MKQWLIAIYFDKTSSRNTAGTANILEYQPTVFGSGEQDTRKHNLKPKFHCFLEPGYSPNTVISPVYETVIEGNSVYIECNVTGVPDPIILWSRPNGLLTSRHEVRGNRLELSKVQGDDSGTYVCTAENKFGKDSSTSVLSVERKSPFFFVLIKGKYICIYTKNILFERLKNLHSKSEVY